MDEILIGALGLVVVVFGGVLGIAFQKPKIFQKMCLPIIISAAVLYFAIGMYNIGFMHASSAATKSIYALDFLEFGQTVDATNAIRSNEPPIGFGLSAISVFAILAWTIFCYWISKESLENEDAS